jgi:hypothetical protein
LLMSLVSWVADRAATGCAVAVVSRGLKRSDGLKVLRDAR